MACDSHLKSKDEAVMGFEVAEGNYLRLDALGEYCQGVVADA